MKHFVEFSAAQMKTLTLLGVAILLGGSYRLVADWHRQPVGPSHAWTAGALDEYQPTLIVDVNYSPADSLELVPGIGPVLAERIVAYRRRHGRFESVDSLINVSGIGPATIDKIKKYIRVSHP